MQHEMAYKSTKSVLMRTVPLNPDHYFGKNLRFYPTIAFVCFTLLARLLVNVTVVVATVTNNTQSSTYQLRILDISAAYNNTAFNNFS